MSNYYEKRRARVNIANELRNRGWKIYGYKEDQSDSMTDYYSPSDWSGICEKNGYILVVDCRYSSEGSDITRYNPNYVEMTSSDKNKIESLKNMTVEKGATAGEEENAKNLIEKINNKYENKGISRYEVIGRTPAHLANSKGCIWHVEKDGALVDKGNQLTIFADIPDSYMFDINTMEFKDSYKYYTNYVYNEKTGYNEPQRELRTLSESEEKAIKAFKSFILRIERAVNGMNSCGDGTAETNQKAMEQQESEKMEKVTINKVKKTLKMVEVDRKEIKVGDYITLPCHGHYWKVTGEHMQKGTWKGVQESRKAFTYEIVGSASRGYKDLKNAQRYYDYEFRMLKSIEEGKIKIFELKEVEEIEAVEKWMKVKTNKNNTSTKKESVKDEPIEKNSINNQSENTSSNDITVKLNDDKNGVEIYFTEKPSEEIRSQLKSNGFRWSKFNSCWYAKQSADTIKFANSLIKAEDSQEQTINNSNTDAKESPYNPTFKEGYVYNVHFKEWNMTIEEIQKEINNMLLTYDNLENNKISLSGLNYEQVLKVEELSNKNGSILFKDYEILENDFAIVENIITQSSSIIEKYNLNYSNYFNSEEYKTELLEHLKRKNVTNAILGKIIDYIANTYNFKGLQEVLKGFLSLDNKDVKKKSTTGDKEKLLKKIDSQIESNNTKIDRLSGDYLTNTWKRMKEQENRDKQRQTLEKDNSILEYLKNRIEVDNITGFEKELVTRALRDEFEGYYRRLVDYKHDSIFPTVNPNWGKDSDWHKEQEKRISRLKKINIINDFQLKNTVMNDYKYIIDNLKTNYNPLEAEIKKLENQYRLNQRGDINFSPKELVQELINLADIQATDKVLEPSAGIGNIVDELKQYTTNIDVVEYNYNFRELLKLKGYNVVGEDFLKYDNYNSYDKIIMNPPFSDEVNHIKQAYRCLKNGGKIVAVSSPHWTFANDKQSIEFREWLDNTNYYEILEHDAKFEKTNVNYKILVIEKLENDNTMAI